MTQLIENDTDTEKSGRAPSTSTCCLLIAARRQVKGFPWEWTLATECSGEPPCSLVMSLQYSGDSLLRLVSHLPGPLSCLDFFLH
ncbi:hypothetical protein LEMLEM_LOCUS756 [Lemmus lemmus]